MLKASRLRLFDESLFPLGCLQQTSSRTMPSLSEMAPVPVLELPGTRAGKSWSKDRLKQLMVCLNTDRASLGRGGTLPECCLVSGLRS